MLVPEELELGLAEPEVADDLHRPPHPGDHAVPAPGGQPTGEELEQASAEGGV
ncbi:hypothetical protein SDC9_97509 [bioreactor metagenome]|uniref:Uncharacterized protein n=1 Tax=bioreactor metagenome TaxID=1076179 RepID=A0A645ACU0_9ZZZZ